jgi:MFS family permease
VARCEAPQARTAIAALRRRPVATGFWLLLLPALSAGVINVLVPLRLDHLGASGVAVGGAFLVAAMAEAALSPVAGRLSDRHGRVAPMRVGLAGAVVMAIVLPLLGTAVLVAAGLVAAVVALAMFWAPSMALISEASEGAGLDQGLAFALSNLAWAGGITMGSSGGGALAEATADFFPYAVVALLCGLTLLRTAQPSRSASRPHAPQGSTPSAR